MYLYYDKNLNLRTKIDHGEKIRQGSDFEIVLCLDNDFDFETNLNSITATIKYNGNKIGNDVISQSNDLEAFVKLYPNENTVDLIDGVSYWMYRFKFDKDPYTLNAGQITFNPTLTYVNENDVVYKTLTFGSADLFIEKTIGFGKQNINLTNNFYNDIKEQLQILEAKKANKVDLSNEEIIVVDGKPVLVSEEFLDLISNENMDEAISKVIELLDSISEKETDLNVNIVNSEGVTVRSLRDTTWKLNENINVEQDLNEINLSFTSNGVSYSRINLFEDAENDIVVVSYDETEVYTEQQNVGNWINDLNRNINITGGNDVDNINVIAWIENNAIIVEKPIDVIRYTLSLSGNILMLTSSDGIISKVTLNYETKGHAYSKAESDANYASLSNFNVLQNRVKALEEQEMTGEVVTSKYVVNTVNDFNFVGGKQSLVYEGDLLLSFTDLKGNFISASDLKVGDTIYNKQTQQPDIWISEIAEALTTLTNTTWKFIYELKGFVESYTFNLTFTSNGEEFVRAVYEPDTGLTYVDSSNNGHTVYSILDNVGTWIDEEYRTINITGGNDVNDIEILEILRGMASFESGNLTTCAVVSILETSLDFTEEGGGTVDLNNYYTKNETDTKFIDKETYNSLAQKVETLEENSPNLDNYYTKEESDAKFATKEDLDKVSTGEVDLTNYYTKEESVANFASKTTETKVNSLEISNSTLTSRVNNLESKFSADLTGSTWLLSSAFPEDSEDVTFNLNFTSNDTQFTKISYIKDELALYYIKSDGSKTTAYFVQDNVWANDEYQTIVISGGTDATNTSAISWLKTVGARKSGGTNIDSDLTSSISALQAQVNGMNERLKALEEAGTSVATYEGEVEIS